MVLERAIRAYLVEAVEAFAAAERRDYAEANVKRDVLAVGRFNDFLFGEYRGKAPRKPPSTDGPERRPRAE
jgi:hypothetical protein